MVNALSVSVFSSTQPFHELILMPAFHDESLTVFNNDLDIHSRQEAEPASYFLWYGYLAFAGNFRHFSLLYNDGITLSKL